MPEPSCSTSSTVFRVKIKGDYCKKYAVDGFVGLIVGKRDAASVQVVRLLARERARSRVDAEEGGELVGGDGLEQNAVEARGGSLGRELNIGRHRHDAQLA